MIKKRLFLGLLLLVTILSGVSFANDAMKFDRLAREEGLVPIFTVGSFGIKGLAYVPSSGRMFYVMPIFGPDGRQLGVNTEFVIDYNFKGDIVLALSNLLTSLAGLPKGDEAVMALICDLATSERYDATKVDAGIISGETGLGTLAGWKSRFVSFQITR